MKLRTNLIILRQKNNLTQQAFGEIIGVSKSSVQSYESGRAEPSYETLKKIVDIFKIDDLYLFLFASSI